MDTTPSYTNGADYNDTNSNYVQLIDKPVFIGVRITFIVLSCVLNTAVISCIIYLYVKRPTSRTSPHLVIILVLSVVVTVFTLVCDTFAVSHQIRVEPDKPLHYDCSTLVAMEVMAYMGSPIANLLVASVIVAEALKLQTFVVLSGQGRKEVIVMLSVLPVLYGLVVIIPVFFNTTLESVMEPCVTKNNNTFLVFEYFDLKKRRVMPICDFLVPQCVIFISSAFLLAVYIFQRYFRYPVGIANLSHQPNNTSMVLNNNCMQERPRFPFQAFLAAAVSFSTGFVFFFQVFVEYNDLNMTSRERQQLWQAGVLLLSSTGVLLPLCWLLSEDLRTVWYCASKPQRGARMSQQAVSGAGVTSSAVTLPTERTTKAEQSAAGESSNVWPHNTQQAPAMTQSPPSHAPIDNFHLTKL